ncbi:hypothetical protein LTR49_027497 [Elasticomyces elasticus]|nr:hypothetical protein LTR49_027497 [Elasticomyces elasticus]
MDDIGVLILAPVRDDVGFETFSQRLTCVIEALRLDPTLGFYVMAGQKTENLALHPRHSKEATRVTMVAIIEISKSYEKKKGRA